MSVRYHIWNNILHFIFLPSFPFFLLLPATVDLYFNRHFSCEIFDVLNLWLIAFSPHSSSDGVDHLIELISSNHRLRSYSSFHFRKPIFATPAFAAPAFLHTRRAGSATFPWLSSLEFARGSFAIMKKEATSCFEPLTLEAVRLIHFYVMKNPPDHGAPFLGFSTLRTSGDFRRFVPPSFQFSFYLVLRIRSNVSSR